MNLQATAGRIVHYTPELDVQGPIAAIVNVDTQKDGLAELTVFYSTGPRVYLRIPYSEQAREGYWSWMPYQKQKALEAGGNQSESAEPRPS